MTDPEPRYRGYGFPPEIISHAVWLYHRFGLSFRDVEDLLAERGVTVTYESIQPAAAAQAGWHTAFRRCTTQYANDRAEVSHQATRLRERLPDPRAAGRQLDSACLEAPDIPDQ